MTIKITSVTGWRRFFTLTYWQMQWRFITGHGRMLNVIETFEIELPDVEPPNEEGEK